MPAEGPVACLDNLITYCIKVRELGYTIYHGLASNWTYVPAEIPTSHAPGGIILARRTSRPSRCASRGLSPPPPPRCPPSSVCLSRPSPSPHASLWRRSSERSRDEATLCLGLVWFLSLFLAHASREKNFSCMKSRMKSICKTFSEISVTSCDESNDGNWSMIGYVMLQ